ncbi:unnamed protein product [Amoebophrya sp. A120]|nr:unnamed protein product [Amoebophrya sp. A120]|eukprot:GSA120T00021995001.1
MNELEDYSPATDTTQPETPVNCSVGASTSREELHRPGDTTRTTSAVRPSDRNTYRPSGNNKTSLHWVWDAATNRFVPVQKLAQQQRSKILLKQQGPPREAVTEGKSAVGVVATTSASASSSVPGRRSSKKQAGLEFISQLQKEQQQQHEHDKLFTTKKNLGYEKGFDQPERFAPVLFRTSSAHSNYSDVTTLPGVHDRSYNDSSFTSSAQDPSWSRSSAARASAAEGSRVGENHYLERETNDFYEGILDRRYDLRQEKLREAKLQGFHNCTSTSTFYPNKPSSARPAGELHNLNNSTAPGDLSRGVSRRRGYYIRQSDGSYAFFLCEDNEDFDYSPLDRSALNHKTISSVARDYKNYNGGGRSSFETATRENHFPAPSTTARLRVDETTSDDHDKSQSELPFANQSTPVSRRRFSSRPSRAAPTPTPTREELELEHYRIAAERRRHQRGRTTTANHRDRTAINNNTTTASQNHNRFHHLRRNRTTAYRAGARPPTRQGRNKVNKTNITRQAVIFDQKKYENLTTQQFFYQFTKDFTYCCYFYSIAALKILLYCIVLFLLVLSLIPRGYYLYVSLLVVSLDNASTGGFEYHWVKQAKDEFVASAGEEITGVPQTYKPFGGDLLAKPLLPVPEIALTSRLEAAAGLGKEHSIDLRHQNPCFRFGKWVPCVRN